VLAIVVHDVGDRHPVGEMTARDGDVAGEMTEGRVTE